MSSFGRILKFAFQDIVRNFGLSCMTIFILVLMLLSINTLWSLDVTTKEAVFLAKNQVNMSLYLAATATDKDVAGIKKYIESFSQVTDVQVLTPTQVLTSFKERHRLSQPVLDALQELGGNPFGPTIVVKAKEPEDYQKIIVGLSIPEYDHIIESKSFAEHEEALSRLQNITNRVEHIGYGLTVLFAIISFLIIFNTIRVAINTQHVEISIKRLVGANNWFIRGPYLVESFIFTVVSLILTIAIMSFAFTWIDPYLSVIFLNGFTLTKYYQSHMLYLFGTQGLAVLLLTMVSSSLAMRRQLKV